MENDLISAVRSFGASDAALASVGDGPPGLPFAVSLAVRLSDEIIDEIDDRPTYTYFNHYRSVNYCIDQILLRTGLWLQERGGRYLTVAASQSRPDSAFEGRYSHKKAACLAGLGVMGRNGLFLHREWGARVRLGTLFTDWAGCEPLVQKSHSASMHSEGTHSGIPYASHCTDCGLCVDACPAGALGAVGTNGTASGDARIDVEKCSAWMKKKYQDIGRGAVCGICIAVCPYRGEK
jgi:epoxyqueuosine reductase QueG